MELPDSNNVYGLLECDGRMEQLADCLQEHMGLPDSEIRLKVSGFDGAKTLIIRSERVEFDGYCTGNRRELLLNGAVAGDELELRSFVEGLHQALKNAGFKPRLEIYDNDKNCIAEFDA